MTTFGAYFDTAGTENDQWVIATAGVVATTEKWSRFEKGWARVLQKHGVTQFHMKDFAHSRGEFTAWRGDNDRRTTFVSSLIQEIKRGVNKSFVMAVDLSRFREIDRRFEVTEAFGGPYALAQPGCLILAWAWLFEKKDGMTKVASFVERGDTGIGTFRRVLKERRIPEPVFIPKVEANGGKIWLPLQAADLIAYEYRKSFEKAATLGQMPYLEDQRRSLQGIVLTLPVDARILTDESIVEFCDKHVPLRSA